MEWRHVPLGTLHLGPIELSVRSDKKLYNCGEDVSLLTPFLSPGEGISPRHRCQLDIVDDEPPPLEENARLLFDNSPVWRLFDVAGGGRVIQRSGRGSDGFDVPFWEAHLSKSRTSVIVYAGKGMEISVSGNNAWVNPVCYPLDQLLLLNLSSKIDALLVHGACFDFGCGAVVFAGRSGAGKTTLSRLVQAYDPECEIITDDRVLVVKTDSGWIAGGTPWPGEGRNAMNVWRPLRALNFLEQGRGNQVTDFSVKDGLENLLPVVSVPWFDVESMTAMLSLCEHLLQETPLKRFLFERNQGAAEAAALLGVS